MRERNQEECLGCCENGRIKQISWLDMFCYLPFGAVVGVVVVPNLSALLANFSDSSADTFLVLLSVFCFLLAGLSLVLLVLDEDVGAALFLALLGFVVIFVGPNLASLNFLFSSSFNVTLVPNFSARRLRASNSASKDTSPLGTERELGTGTGGGTLGDDDDDGDR